MKTTISRLLLLGMMGFLALAQLSYAQAPAADLHVKADALAAWLTSENPPVVIDVRQAAAFAEGHIPNAVNVWRPDYGAKKGAYNYNGMRAEAAEFHTLLGKLGIESSTPIVTYTSSGLHDAYRFAWLLEMYGHPRDSIWVLDGGLAAWKATGELLSTEARAPVATTYNAVRAVDISRLALLEDVIEATKQPNVLILDSRTLEEHLGIALYSGAVRRGHIPGSIHINYTENFDENGIKDVTALKALYESKGITADKTIIVYCQSGVRSAMTTKILNEMLGYPNVMNYDGSWIEWSHSDQPVVSYFLIVVVSLLALVTAALIGFGVKSKRKGGSSKLIKFSILPMAILAFFLLWYYGLLSMISMSGVQDLQAWVQSFGWLGPVVFIVLFALAAVFFLPGAPFAIVAAIAFGPIMGTVWASIGSTLGACLAFLVARYLVRDYAENLIAKNPKLRAIDNGVEKHGWRMLMITRFVPVFPFNVQNYIYGITKIPFATYALLSWLFMLPGTLAYVFITGAAVSGASIGVIMTYFSIGAIVLVGLSFVPKLLKKKSMAADVLG